MAGISRDAPRSSRDRCHGTADVADHGQGWCARRIADTCVATELTGMPSPRIRLVLRFWQCDKENHGWREGPPLTVLCRDFDPWGLHPPGKFSSNEKRILPVCTRPQILCFE